MKLGFEIFNWLVMLFSSFVIIFQVLMIKDLQEQVRNRNELVKYYREFFEYILEKLKEKNERT